MPFGALNVTANSKCIFIFLLKVSSHSCTTFQQIAVFRNVQSGFSSSMGRSSQQQITLSNKAFSRRSWTLLLHDCFLSRRATINPLSPLLTPSFHLIYIALSSPPLPAAAFFYLSLCLTPFCCYALKTIPSLQEMMLVSCMCSFCICI